MVNSASCCIGAWIGVALIVASAASAQDTLSADDLVDLLQNRAPDAVISPAELERQQRNHIVIEGLKRRSDRGEGLGREDRNRLEDIRRQERLASVDLEIYFDYDSAAIKPASVATLSKLGRALTDGTLARATFLVAGHTDAKGSNEYNLRLSERRARAVRSFLVSNFGIDPARLMAVGYGEEQLRNRFAPFAGENRRVQVVNLSR